MRCGYFEAGVCRSCTWLADPYADQLARKDLLCREALGPRDGLAWLPPLASVESGFRTKAKMVAGGTVDAPTLGILDGDGSGVDLQGCPLYPPQLTAAFAPLAELVTRARIVPYDVPNRRGELKLVHVMVSPDGELMVRLVLRSNESVPRVRKQLPWLLGALPALRVVSVNLLPEHKAAVEGAREIVLTEQATLPMRLDGLVLHVRPQSFFQTNTSVATELYRTATRWVLERAPRSMWDLYCGVGGFALHAARAGVPDVLGVESSAEAVESARTSAADLGLTGVRFESGDATAQVLATTAADVPDLVVVNPPRRGIGPDLAGWLERSGVRHVVYSSCYAPSLARDLDDMPSLRPRRAQVLDMFPHTGHYEVLTMLERD